MTLKILKEKENPLFNRNEISVEVQAEITPSNKDAVVLISKEFTVPEENIKINGIYGRFGSKEFKINANIYKSKQDKDKTERKSKKEIEAGKKPEAKSE